MLLNPTSSSVSSITLPDTSNKQARPNNRAGPDTRNPTPKHISHHVYRPTRHGPHTTHRTPNEPTDFRSYNPKFKFKSYTPTPTHRTRNRSRDASAWETTNTITIPSQTQSSMKPGRPPYSKSFLMSRAETATSKVLEPEGQVRRKGMTPVAPNDARCPSPSLRPREVRELRRLERGKKKEMERLYGYW